MESSSLIQGAGAFFYSRYTQRWLFLMRSDGRHENTWGLVGGKSENNETPVQTLHREIFEEIGVTPAIQKIIPIEKFTNANFEYHTYVCIVDEEFIPTLNNEHKGYCWTDISSYPRPLHPGVFSSLNLDVIVEKIRTIQATIF